MFTSKRWQTNWVKLLPIPNNKAQSEEFLELQSILNYLGKTLSNNNTYVNIITGLEVFITSEEEPLSIMIMPGVISINTRDQVYTILVKGGPLVIPYQSKNTISLRLRNNITKPNPKLRDPTIGGPIIGNTYSTFLSINVDIMLNTKDGIPIYEVIRDPLLIKPLIPRKKHPYLPQLVQSLNEEIGTLIGNGLGLSIIGNNNTNKVLMVEPGRAYINGLITIIDLPLLIDLPIDKDGTYYIHLNQNKSVYLSSFTKPLPNVITKYWVTTNNELIYINNEPIISIDPISNEGSLNLGPSIVLGTISIEQGIPSITHRTRPYPSNLDLSKLEESIKHNNDQTLYIRQLLRHRVIEHPQLEGREYFDLSNEDLSDINNPLYYVSNYPNGIGSKLINKIVNPNIDQMVGISMITKLIMPKVNSIISTLYKVEDYLSLDPNTINNDMFSIRPPLIIVDPSSTTYNIGTSTLLPTSINLEGLTNKDNIEIRVNDKVIYLSSELTKPDPNGYISLSFDIPLVLSSDIGTKLSINDNHYYIPNLLVGKDYLLLSNNSITNPILSNDYTYIKQPIYIDNPITISGIGVSISTESIMVDTVLGILYLLKDGVIIKSAYLRTVNLGTGDWLSINFDYPIDLDSGNYDVLILPLSYISIGISNNDNENKLSIGNPSNWEIQDHTLGIDLIITKDDFTQPYIDISINEPLYDLDYLLPYYKGNPSLTYWHNDNWVGLDLLSGNGPYNLRLSLPNTIINWDATYFIIKKMAHRSIWLSKELSIPKPYNYIDLSLTYIGIAPIVYISSDKGNHWINLSIDEDIITNINDDTHRISIKEKLEDLTNINQDSINLPNPRLSLIIKLEILSDGISPTIIRDLYVSTCYITS